MINKKYEVKKRRSVALGSRQALGFVLSVLCILELI